MSTACADSKEHLGDRSGEDTQFRARETAVKAAATAAMRRGLPFRVISLSSREKGLGRRYWLVVALLLAICLPFTRPSWAIVALLFSIGDVKVDDVNVRPILGPVPIAHGGHAVLERHAELKLPRMRIVAGRRFDEQAVRDTQARLPPACV